MELTPESGEIGVKEHRSIELWSLHGGYTVCIKFQFKALSSIGIRAMSVLNTCITELF